ncbi:unnamed protein product [Leptosia nina]|uniref:unspecific monooxygenase n=1 Tax=Leptosia nina TaxID=320188 RepID=A0AAV1JWU7_9NEOP
MEVAYLKGYLVTLVLICILVIIFLVYCRYKLNYWKRRGVTQLDRADKIFGDFKRGILFRSPPGYHFGELYHESSKDAPYVGFYIFHKPCLLLKDPQIIKQILVRDFHKFSNRNFSRSQEKDSSGMRNLFGIENPAWRYLRKKFSPNFTRRKLKQLLNFMMQTGEPMMEYMKSGPEGSKVIDVQDVNYRYSADLITSVALGFQTDSFQCSNSDYTKFFMNYFHSWKRMVAVFTVFFVPELITVLGARILYDSSFIEQKFWQILNAREKSDAKRGDFIDTLIELKNREQDSLYKFEGGNLFAQSSMFFSGFQTSSHVCSFTIMELARNKECQERARDCVQKAIAKHGWTFEGFNAMKYMDQVIAEGVRMHPAVPILDRYALEDYKIPNTDLTIEKGTPIYVSLYGIHRDPQFFDQPDVFDPERFNGDRSIPDNYLPFGTGPRKCVGMKAGRLFIKVMISMILSEYRLHQRTTEQVRLDKRATFLSAEKGIYVEFTKI